MTTRIDGQIVGGELFNYKRNSVHGWLAMGEEKSVRLELTGNLSGELAGQQVRFQPSQPAPENAGSREAFESLGLMQCGVVGQIELRSSTAGPRILYLEWFGQHGQVIAEVVDPVLEFGPAEDEHEESPPADADDMLDFLQSSGEPSPDSDDPYGLFPANLEQQLSAAGEEDERLPGAFADESAVDEEPAEEEPTEWTGEAAAGGKQRSWDEVIPGIDPETKRMYEEWDEVIDGTKDVPFHELFDPPLVLKRPADIADEAEAEEQLRQLLARLALHCVVIHRCEHFTALETFRWLVEDLLPEEGVHPQLGPTGFFRHYDTSEHCPACEAEFEAKWNESQRGDD
jgi:hypothetical protein